MDEAEAVRRTEIALDGAARRVLAGIFDATIEMMQTLDEDYTDTPLWKFRRGQVRQRVLDSMRNDDDTVLLSRDEDVAYSEHRWAEHLRGMADK